MDTLKTIYKSTDGAEKFFNSLYGETTEFQKNRYKLNLENFNKAFNENGAYIASSSGRVEVCGNHTDHNGGAVISCAISLDTLSMFLPTDDGIITIKSDKYPDVVVDINGPEIEEKGTSDALVRGVVVAMKERGFKVGGLKAFTTSNVSGGAGVSSSASFEVLVVEMLNFLYNDCVICDEDKSRIAQFAENVYFGKPCGLLDQTAIAFGGLKKLDFADKSKIVVTDIKNDLKDYTFVLINTGGSHANLTDEYASIPKEMKEVASAFGKERLIDIPEEEFYEKLPSVVGDLSDRAVGRAIHFYTENKRVNCAQNALDKGDYDCFLKCIKNSGISSFCKLQNCYVQGGSDQLIPKALFIAEEYLCGGANRVHGGGFAGTILNIVKNDNAEKFINTMRKFYPEKDVIPLKVRSVGTIVL